MNKILFLILAFILIACSPQATVTSPPPTETPIPTPTLHPDFVALQDLIADSSDRFTLLPDGTIEETTGDGKRIIPNLHVDQNGIINIIFNNEHVAIEQFQITFDDENGLIIDGYELNENGEWVEAGNPLVIEATKLLDIYNIDPDTYELTETENGVTVTDRETGTVLLQSNEKGELLYGISMAVDIVAKASCQPTDFAPKTSSPVVTDEHRAALKNYLGILKRDANYPINGTTHFILVDREKQCWAFANSNSLIFRDQDGVAHNLPLVTLKEKELVEFLYSR